MSGNVGYIQGPTILAATWGVLSTLTFPASTVYSQNGGKPAVWFCGTFNEQSFEQIELMGDIDAGEVEWHSTGPIQAETLTLNFEIRSHVRGVQYPAALARVDELARVVQDGFRNAVTGEPAGLVADGKLVQSWRFDSYHVQAVRLEDKGWGCTMPLTLRLQTHR